MNIDTTINIKEEILEKIDEASKDCSISRSRLISLLLKKVISEKTNDKNRFARIKYQKRDKKASWKRPHVFLEYDLYEKCIDMRKLKKMSVSFIVSVAFKLYFAQVIEELKNGCESDVSNRNYVCIGKRKGRLFSYTVFWDYPPEDELIKTLE